MKNMLKQLNLTHNFKELRNNAAQVFINLWLLESIDNNAFLGIENVMKALQTVHI